MGNKKIGIIGVGNMGGAIAAGLVKSDFVAASDIFVFDPKEKNLSEMREMGITTCESNKETVRKTDVVIVAVKPYHIEGVLQEIKSELTSDKICISIVAGVAIEDLAKMAGGNIFDLYFNQRE